MPYRVKQDGTIEMDTPQEALELASLLDRKKHGRRPNTNNEGVTANAPKESSRRHSAPKTRTAAKNGRRPKGAVDHGVRLGQIYEKHKGGNSAGRVIQIAELLKDGIIPKIVKDAEGIKRKGACRKLSYTVLTNAYRLIKDV